MYAVIKTGGKQYKVSQGEVLRVERLPYEVGATVEIKDVLMVVNDSDVKIGKPVVADASVTAEVLGHGLGDKLVMMKKRRRKGSKVKHGHRQTYTALEVKAISA
ncbi:MAG: 50S ribosomal protein L21 [Deltaproteobacteria bacterium]|jgi:large subunit ribosomal protein L21|nr:50S ribosomal protein L21 [Deltaproteobacteria bacterium]